MKLEAAATLAVVCLQASTLVVQLPVSFNVLCTACGVVVVGAARSLEPLRSGAPAAAGGPPARRSDDAVTLSAGDAARFPLVGSGALVGAYALIKVFGRALLNALLTVYFVALGIVYSVELDDGFNRVRHVARRVDETGPEALGPIGLLVGENVGHQWLV